jgi:hypothetical protein
MRYLRRISRGVGGHQLADDARCWISRRHEAYARRVDPFTATGAIAAVVDLAKGSGEAMDSLRKALPESSRFWKHFEGALKNDRDMPWEEIRKHSYLQPAFFGRSCCSRGSVRPR